MGAPCLDLLDLMGFIFETQSKDKRSSCIFDRATDDTKSQAFGQKEELLTWYKITSQSFGPQV